MVCAVYTATVCGLVTVVAVVPVTVRREPARPVQPGILAAVFHPTHIHTAAHSVCCIHSKSATKFREMFTKMHWLRAPTMAKSLGRFTLKDIFYPVID